MSKTWSRKHSRVYFFKVEQFHLDTCLGHIIVVFIQETFFNNDVYLLDFFGTENYPLTFPYKTLFLNSMPLFVIFYRNCREHQKIRSLPFSIEIHYSLAFHSDSFRFLYLQHIITLFVRL